MNEVEFKKAWVLLLAQPWARDYTFDEDKGAIQYRIYWAAFRAVEGKQWLAVVEWWIMNEDHWPLVPQLRTHINRLTPSRKTEPLTFGLISQAPEDPACEPYRSVCVAWSKRGGGESVFSCGSRIMREYLAKHPHDSLVAQRLAKWEGMTRGGGKVTEEPFGFC